jgi:hypothetical protein
VEPPGHFGQASDEPSPACRAELSEVIAIWPRPDRPVSSDGSKGLARTS